jgi:hypothetical protein
MIVGMLFGSLVGGVSTDRAGCSVSHPFSDFRTTERRSYTAAEASCDLMLIRRAATDPHFVQLSPNDEIGDLIVKSIAQCLPAVRALIDAHDEFFPATAPVESFFHATLSRRPSCGLSGFSNNFSKQCLLGTQK